jgi:hypothetical protein
VLVVVAWPLLIIDRRICFSAVSSIYILSFIHHSFITGRARVILLRSRAKSSFICFPFTTVPHTSRRDTRTTGQRDSFNMSPVMPLSNASQRESATASLMMVETRLRHLDATHDDDDDDDGRHDTRPSLAATLSSAAAAATVVQEPLLPPPASSSSSPYLMSARQPFSPLLDSTRTRTLKLYEHHYHDIFQ